MPQANVPCDIFAPPHLTFAARAFLPPILGLFRSGQSKLQGRAVEAFVLDAMAYSCPSVSVQCASYFTSQSGLDPCCAAQMVDQSCGLSYTISAKSNSTFKESLYIPNATTASYTTCSWASYNLLSACAICTQQSTWASWATYSASCGNYVSSTTYYPWDQGCRLPENEKIPFFAATNPIYWTNGTFNENEAAVNGSSGTPDVTGQPLASSSPSATSTSSSSSSGAIIGGIVGALAVFGLAGFILWYIVRRRRHQARLQPASQQSSSSPPLPHPSMAQTVTSPYKVTSTLSSQEFPNASQHFASPMSPMITSPLSAPITDAADMISPFFSPIRSVPTTTKSAEALVGRNESPPPRRGRMNPPPYSPTAPAGSSSSSSPSPPPPRHPYHSEKRIKRVANCSVDTATTTAEADSAPLQGPPSAKPICHAEARPQATRMRSGESEDSTRSAGTVFTSVGVGSAHQRDARTDPRTSRKRPPVV